MHASSFGSETLLYYKQILKDFYALKGYSSDVIEYMFGSWDFVDIQSNTPQQPSGYDCALYSCHTIFCASTGKLFHELNDCS